MAKGGLGSGLDFLFDESVSEVQVKKSLRLMEIEPNHNQPRKRFSEESIAALADSIQQHGMLQPILVRPYNGSYQIVAGERRWRAARMLGLDEIPVIIKEISDAEAMQIALIENLQRENLNPIEEAAGYQELVTRYGMTQEQVAKIVGRSRSAISNALRMLQLPQKVQDMLSENQLTAGHAKALMGISDEKLMLMTAQRAANGALTVRAIERIAAEEATLPAEPYKPDSRVKHYFKEVEIGLAERLGRHVTVKYEKNKGKLILDFYDEEDLSALVNHIAYEP